MKNFDSNDDKEPKNPGLRGDTFRVYQEEAKLILMEKFIKDDNSSGWELILGIDQGGTGHGWHGKPNSSNSCRCRVLYFVREMVLNGEMDIHLIGTEWMMGDWMTKPVDRDKFFRCRTHAMGGGNPVTD